MSIAYQHRLHVSRRGSSVGPEYIRHTYPNPPWLMTGLGFGCNYIATLTYVAEVAPRSLQGSFVGTVCQFGYQLGTLIAFWAGYGMSFHTTPFNIAWRVSNVIQIPIGIGFVGLSFFYPER